MILPHKELRECFWNPNNAKTNQSTVRVFRCVDSITRFGVDVEVDLLNEKQLSRSSPVYGFYHVSTGLSMVDEYTKQCDVVYAALNGRHAEITLGRSPNDCNSPVGVLSEVFDEVVDGVRRYGVLDEWRALFVRECFSRYIERKQLLEMETVEILEDSLVAYWYEKEGNDDDINYEQLLEEKIESIDLPVTAASFHSRMATSCRAPSSPLTLGV